MSLYFENIIGNDKLKSMLASYIKNNSIPHAFIIEGPRGSGKKLIAKSVCAALSCKNKHYNSIPCNECINCEKIFKNVSPDVIVIDSNGKSTIGVDVIRELKTHTYMSSNELDKKAYIIDEADKLTVQAQNAFLKILEEPTTDIIYFLLCENSGILLPTIISRAPIIRTTSAERNDVYTYVKKNYPNLTEDRVTTITALSRGNIGMALLYCNDSPELEDAENIRECVYDFLTLLSNKSTKYDFMSFFTTHAEKSFDRTELLRQIYSSMRDIILYKELKNNTFDFFIDEQDLINKSKNIKSKFSKKLCILIENTIEQLQFNQGPSSTESIMLNFALKTWSARI